MATWLALGTLAGAATVSVSLSVERQADERFSLSEPPNDLSMGESGLCRIRHALSQQSTVLLETTSGSYGYQVRLQSSEIDIRIALATQLVLPYGAGTGLIAHEDGHREIAEALLRSFAEIVAEHAYSSVATMAWVAQAPDQAHAEQEVNDRFRKATGEANRFTLAAIAAIDEAFNRDLYHQMLHAQAARTADEIEAVVRQIVSEVSSSATLDLVDDALRLGRASTPVGTTALGESRAQPIAAVIDWILASYSGYDPPLQRAAARLHASLSDEANPPAWRELLAELVLLSVKHEQGIGGIAASGATASSSAGRNAAGSICAASCDGVSPIV